MKTIPKFSVIIPAFNAAYSIARAIDSVIAQIYQPHEIIIIDDGSGDNTKHIVSQYSTDIVKYYYQKNNGVSSARNEGVAMASGDWITFLDADDWYYNDRLQLHADLINKYPDLDFMTGNFDFIDLNGNHLGSSMEKTSVGLKLLAKAGSNTEVLLEDEDLIEFIEHPFGDTRTLSLRPKKFMEVGGFPVQFNICEDVHFLIRLCAVSRCAGVVCQSMAAYLVHEKGLIRSDTLRAQTETLSALQSLQKDNTIVQNKNALQGLKSAIRRARLDLAYTFLKLEERKKALLSVLPLIIQRPNIQSVKDIFSILHG